MTPDAVEKSAAFPMGRPNDGHSAVVKYLTGYVVEKSLSVDNIFVMAVLFRVLRGAGDLPAPGAVLGDPGGAGGAGAMIGVGAALIAVHWMLYLFGGFLMLTAVKMLFSKERVRTGG